MISAAAVTHVRPAEAEMWKEFRDFIARGNVVDLAVGLIMGAAFGSGSTTAAHRVIGRG